MFIFFFNDRLRKPKDPEYRDFQNQGQPNGHMELEIINNEYVRINPLVEKCKLRHNQPILV